MNRFPDCRAGMTALLLVHCKKELAVFPSPAGMSLIKLFLGGNNLFFSRPERVWSVTSRLGTGKWLTLFYSVPARQATQDGEIYSSESIPGLLERLQLRALILMKIISEQIIALKGLGATKYNSFF
jgi:hypothetical protein